MGLGRRETLGTACQEGIDAVGSPAPDFLAPFGQVRRYVKIPTPSTTGYTENHGTDRRHSFAVPEVSSLGSLILVS
jgi:hypothetical protein